MPSLSADSSEVPARTAIFRLVGASFGQRPWFDFGFSILCRLVDQHTEGNPIRLLLLDDRGLFRTSLARFLASEPGLSIAAECDTPAEALQMLNGTTVDIVLLDFV